MGRHQKDVFTIRGEQFQFLPKFPGKQYPFVYLMLRPDGSPFYVGKAASSSRMRGHIGEYVTSFKEGRASRKVLAMNDAFVQNGELTYLVYRCDTTDQTEAIEAALIKEYGDQLLNVAKPTTWQNSESLADHFTKEQVGEICSVFFGGVQQ